MTDHVYVIAGASAAVVVIIIALVAASCCACSRRKQGLIDEIESRTHGRSARGRGGSFANPGNFVNPIEGGVGAAAPAAKRRVAHAKKTSIHQPPHHPSETIHNPMFTHDPIATQGESAPRASVVSNRYSFFDSQPSAIANYRPGRQGSFGDLRRGSMISTVGGWEDAADSSAARQHRMSTQFYAPPNADTAV
jgi:hypothetical protein